MLVSDDLPRGVLSVHSSKAHLIESMSLANFALADAIIELAMSKGQRHEVNFYLNEYLIFLKNYGSLLLFSFAGTLIRIQLPITTWLTEL